MRNETLFKSELCDMINRYSIDNETNTPDFILTEYLILCLKTFNKTNKKLKEWHTGVYDDY